jgi:hypothetical protein
MYNKIIDFIKTNIFNKSFILGLVLTVGIFSKYIFGYNNLGEELAELIFKIITNKDVNFSPEEPEDPQKDLNRLIGNYEDIK